MTFALALLMAAGAHAPIRAPVISPGCQGELCYSTGSWIAKRDLPLFDRVNGTRRIGTIRKGTHVEALEGRVVTTKVGLARMLVTGDYLHGYGSKGPRVHVRKGELVYLLHLEGEGLFAAMTRDGRRISINGDPGDGDSVDYRKLLSYEATDWVKVRLPNGHVGWSTPREDFLCSDHMDDMPGQCGGIAESRH